MVLVSSGGKVVYEGLSAKVVEESISSVTGIALKTFQLRYPRFIHSELMTHRVFSRNAGSSRAIPVQKVLSQVWNEPAMPLHWGANQPGMQAKAELSPFKKALAKFAWKTASRLACCMAWSMMKIGLHKQAANRILEPFQFIEVVLTATDFDNWYELRKHKDAQPEIWWLAKLMSDAELLSEPKILNPGEWHLPYVTLEERQKYSLDLCKRMSAARCARVSYLTHDSKQPEVQKDIGLFDRLVGSRPLHASPTEHQATPTVTCEYNKNFKGWQQFRVEVEELIFNQKED